jgi:hypothetical protein
VAARPSPSVRVCFEEELCGDPVSGRWFWRSLDYWRSRPTSPLKPPLARLRGTIADASGAVLPGVTVELSGEAQIGGAQTAVTDRNGQFRFTSLSPGTYTVKASLEGFKMVILQDVRVEVGRTFEVALSLEVGSLQETVTVRGESPLVDTARSAVTVNYPQEFLKNTPVDRFSVFDMFQMTPGISPSQVQDSTQSSAFGSNTNENQYQIDGTDITSPTNSQMWPFPNTDIVEEMELVGVGAPAEYGGMQGAVFNVVTKSGGNEVRGLANWFSQFQGLTGGGSGPISIVVISSPSPAPTPAFSPRTHRTVCSRS